LDAFLDKHLTICLDVPYLDPRQTLDRKEKEMRKWDGAALVLAIVGALNWGLVAIGEFDLVAKIFGMEFGQTNALTRVVYGLVGLSGAWLAIRFAAVTGRERRAAVAAA
jgi:uncharacterized membrane protein YuzA (DUF378 family)